MSSRRSEATSGIHVWHKSLDFPLEFIPGVDPRPPLARRLAFGGRFRGDDNDRGRG
jgi:hypothetical protein